MEKSALQSKLDKYKNSFKSIRTAKEGETTYRVVRATPYYKDLSDTIDYLVANIHPDCWDTLIIREEPTLKGDGLKKKYVEASISAEKANGEVFTPSPLTTKLIFKAENGSTE